ncbi:MAG: hypothetical protein ACI8P9_003035 [Parasphingorhabdus sp.]|jgi:hypothetical protein
MLFLCRQFLLLVILLGAVTGVFADFWQDSISKEQWDSYAQGKELHRMDSIRELLGLFQEKPGYKLTIRHPGGEEGFAWGEALKHWLVALGIPSGYVITLPGSGGLNILHLSMSYPGE